jgi:hypothetical protein
MSCITTLICCLLLNHVIGRGHVEIQFLQYRNEQSRLSSGLCCDVFCSNNCDNRFQICYREYVKGSLCQMRETKEWSSDNIIFSFGHNALGYGVSNPLLFQFEKRWLGSFSLKVTVRDGDYNAPDLVTELTLQVPRAPISNQSTVATLKGIYATLKLGWRVICDHHYYNDCSVYCKAQSSDETGHYACDQYGNKVCHTGWTGSNCTISSI